MECTQCKGLNKNGARCKNECLAGYEFCRIHKKQGRKTKIAPVVADQDAIIDDVIADVVVDDEFAEVAGQEIPPSAALVADLEAEIERLTKKCQDLMISGKTQDGISYAKIEQRARLMFYHDNKKDPFVTEEIKKGLMTGGILVARHNGKVVHHEAANAKPVIPWVLIKAYTDQYYDTNVSDDIKAGYRAKATASIQTKMMAKMAK
jgi:hypothetical protein